MQRNALPILLLTIQLFILPFWGMAQQGSAKYNTTLNGKQIALKLTNGFAGSGEIKMNNITYYANSGHADATDHMMFQSKHIQTIEYFILANIQDSYGTFPALITGKYYHGRKAVKVSFKLDK